MDFPILYFLIISVSIFLIGLWGLALNKKNIILIIMSIELILLGVNLNFLIFSSYLDDLKGQIFSLLILTVAAAESSIGLALLVILYKKYESINLENIYTLHG